MNDAMINQLNGLLKQQQAQLRKSVRILNEISKNQPNEQVQEISSKIHSLIENKNISQEEVQKIFNELTEIK